MSRPIFAVVVIVFAAIVLLGMWLGWRARIRRDSVTPVPSAGLAGEVLATFVHAGYVSTTPVGSPFERVALDGLRYKGFADVTARRDGVSITVTGEDPVDLPASQVLGTATASGRVGKAVERDGLSLLRWRHTGSDGAERELESSFRFTEPVEQTRFDEAIAAMLDPVRTSRQQAATQISDTQDTTQEDA